MSRPLLLPLITVHEIQERLLKIFPEGTPNRGYCTREIAAKAIFVMLYIGAVEDENRFLRPDQVTRMTDAQATRIDEESRLTWARESYGKLETCKADGMRQTLANQSGMKRCERG
jgi:hypothetical protein